MADQKVEGWMAFDKETGVGGMKWQEFEPKAFRRRLMLISKSRIVVRVCGTDVHSLKSDQLFPTNYPCCVGHEIVGVISRVGAKVSNGLKVGAIVGVGSQIGSCSQCEACISGKENYCPKVLLTYGAQYPSGFKTYVGFASHWRGPSDWVVAIPAGIPPAEAAPMLCGGITVYSPLKRFGAGPGKNVGIVGAGGLGHLGIMFAKALGADKVGVLSRSNSKKTDMLMLGATDYVAMDEDDDWMNKHASSMDIIICTASSSQTDGMLSLLRANGAFIQVGSPNMPLANPIPLIFRGLIITGSLIGSPAQIREMLDFAAAHDIHSLIQERPMKDANRVVEDLDKGSARYRYW